MAMASMSQESPIMARRQLPWSDTVWQHLDEVVLDEARQIRTAARFLPIYRPGEEARTVPSQRLLLTDQQFTIDEAPVTPLIELWTEFTLTRQQVERETELHTAATLARRGANLLAQAEDALLYRGTDALQSQALFTQGTVFRRSQAPSDSLLEAALATDSSQRVTPPEADNGRFGDATFEAVAQGYVRLQQRQHHGPYAIALPPALFADTQAPLPATLLRPAERIAALLETELIGTGTLPPATGLLLSLGGSTFELVVGREPEVMFLFEDAAGKYHFRVWERFALRVQDKTAVIRLDFTT